MIRFHKLKTANKKACEEVNMLLAQLSSSSKPLTPAPLKKMLAAKHTEFWAVCDGKKIVGMGGIVFWQAPTGTRSRIEDVVIDEAYRGRGLGEALTKKLIAAARHAGAKDIELSSRPSRAAANGLYQKLGFEHKETNVYSLKLK